MKIESFSNILLATLLVSSFSTNAMAQSAKNDPNVRSSQYIDSTRENNLSGWKVMLTNAYPDKLLETGRWFSPSPVPLPFVTGEMKSFPEELKKKLVDNSTDAILVVKRGQIVGQYFRYGFAIDDIHLIHSTGTAFTSFAIQPIYDRLGKFGLDKTLQHYLPRLKESPIGSATLAQALDMTAGTAWSENHDDPKSATMISGPIGGWDPIERGEAPKSWYTMFNYPQVGQHGKTWVYSSASVIAASFAAAAKAGKPYAELVQDSYNKLGFEDRSYFISNSFNELSAEGGQALSIRDFAKLGRFMLEVEDSAYVNDVWNMDDTVSKYIPKKKFAFVKGYKNYWYELDPGVILALDSSGQFLYLDWEKDLIIAKFSSFVREQGATEFGAGLGVIEEISNLYR